MDTEGRNENGKREMERKGKRGRKRGETEIYAETKKGKKLFKDIF